MLFLFQVNTGRMTTFDTGLTVKDVSVFQLEIEKILKIPVTQQILLISGGQHLEPDKRLGSYPAGADTNPYFLFDRGLFNNDIDLPSHLNMTQPPEIDFVTKVEESLLWPASYSAVEKRAKISQSFAYSAEVDMKVLERLVLDQHLQQQGWAAAVASLEDIDTSLKIRWEHYKKVFDDYISKREFYLEFLNNFDNDLKLLKKIPLLPGLLENQNIYVPDVVTSSQGEDPEEKSPAVSLFDWIKRQEGFIDQLYDTCAQGLMNNDQQFFQELQTNFDNLVDVIKNNAGMKEVGGLSNRLSHLELIMQEARIIVGEQRNTADCFQRNRMRTTEVKEDSVLPDLCHTHIQQLNDQLDLFKKLRDLLRRVVNGKIELCMNLNVRLNWLVIMQGKYVEMDSKVVHSYQKLNLLKRHLDVLQQVHTAPSLYLSSVVEVVRRRKLSQALLLWASDVACHTLTIYNDELARRNDFKSQIKDHFLGSLFSGMEDLPPTFATQAPSVFDSKLPKLTDEDIEHLQKELPEQAALLEMSDLTTILNYFMLKDAKDDVDKPVEDKLIEVVTEAGLASNDDQNFLKAIENETGLASGASQSLPLLKDLDKGCESETDTEEFEKVGQSPFDLHFDKTILLQRPGTQDVSTLTEDDLQVSRSEYERLSETLRKVSSLTTQEITNYKAELSELSNQLKTARVDFGGICDNLSTTLVDVILRKDNDGRERIQRLIVDHELEISDFREKREENNEEIKKLSINNKTLLEELETKSCHLQQLENKLLDDSSVYLSEIAALEQKIIDLNLDKEKSIQTVTDKLKSEQRTELENIRARFKLMTMDKSPSENSLEKIERGDCSSFTNTEALVLQMTENFESEKEVAVSDAIRKEEEKWQRIIEEKTKELELQFQLDRQILIADIEKSAFRDKDLLIDRLKEQINNLGLECLKYKTTIQQLTERDSSDEEWMKRVECLEKENIELQIELSKLKTIQTPMAASVAVCESRNDKKVDNFLTQSTIRTKKRSELNCKWDRISTDTCRSGDLVMVTWEPTFQNFRILQDDCCMYFMRPECMTDIGLTLVDGMPNKYCCYAEVIDKELCRAKKPINRFRVSEGTKFYRVRVKSPSIWKYNAPLENQQSHTVQMSQSQTIPSSTRGSSDSAPTQSLPSSPVRTLNWDDSEKVAIPEEVGEDSGAINDDVIEKATELTEGFNIDKESNIGR